MQHHVDIEATSPTDRRGDQQSLLFQVGSTHSDACTVQCVSAVPLQKVAVAAALYVREHVPSVDSHALYSHSRKRKTSTPPHLHHRIHPPLSRTYKYFSFMSKGSYYVRVVHYYAPQHRLAASHVLLFDVFFFLTARNQRQVLFLVRPLAVLHVVVVVEQLPFVTSPATTVALLIDAPPPLPTPSPRSSHSVIGAVVSNQDLISVNVATTTTTTTSCDLQPCLQQGQRPSRKSAQAQHHS